MYSIQDVSIAVDDGNQNEIQSLLSEIDLKTESQVFQKAAEEFGFKTFEHRGRRYAMRSELASVFGYLDESGLRKLCERYDFEGLPLGTFGQDVRIKIREELGLPAKDGKTIFVGWNVFLLAAMEATNSAAKKVKVYLLKAERASRIGSGAVDAMKQRQAALHELDTLSKVATRIDRMQSKNLGQRVYNLSNTLLDDVFKEANPGQPDLFRDEGEQS